MNQIMRWRDFIESEEFSLTPKSNAILMVILYKTIEPQPLFSLIVQSGKKVKPEDYGYLVEDGKIARDNGAYLSPEMGKIKEWCTEHRLHYAFENITDGGPLLDDLYLEVHGDITQEALDTFPLAARLKNVVSSGNCIDK